MNGRKWSRCAAVAVCTLFACGAISLGDGMLSSAFRSDGDLISGWYWLRDGALAQQAWWTFEGVPSGAADIALEITCLATDTVNGSRGVPAVFRLGVGSAGTGVMGGVYTVEEVTLPNVSASTDPVGYTCRGTLRVPPSLPGPVSGTLTVFIERASPAGPHVAFREDSIVLHATGLTDGGTATATTDLSCQRIVSGLLALTGNIEVPEHLVQEGALKRGDEFDAAAYFTVLDRLSMEPGYALDYVYRFEGIGGDPVLYARPEAQAPFAAYEDLAAAQGDPEGTFLTRIRIDSTPGHPEGFFQFVVLELMGEQFYLYWHALYDDTLILCGRDAIEKVLLTLDGSFGAAMPESDKERARAINVEPWVSIGDDFVRVRIVTFSKWGGFSERIYTISHAFPHQVLDVQSTPLVGYSCGVMF